MSEPLRLVFMGSDPLALPLLGWLAGEGGALARIVGVVTGADRPSGRGQRLQPNAIKAWAADRGLAVLQPERFDAQAAASLADLRPDLSLVVAYGQILKDEVISIPSLGTLNLHASLLPKYRGASPIQSAIASGETETGMALMRIVRELDAGPVAAVERVPIEPLDTASDVEARLAAASVPLLGRALPLIARGELTFRDQDALAATYCRRLNRSDGGLDFAAPAQVLARRVNALFPWPSVSIDLAGESVKVGLADALQASDGAAPGTVLGPDSCGLLVAAGSGVLRLRRLQRPGGRMLDAAEFLRGRPAGRGGVLTSVRMTELVGREPFRR